MPISHNASPLATLKPKPKCAAGWGRASGCMAFAISVRPSAADDLVQQVLLKMIEALRAGRLRER